MPALKLQINRLAAALAIMAGATLASGSVSAQEGCQADLAKFCPQAKPGGGETATCLKANAAQLSPSCKARVKEMQGARKEADQACEEDIHAFCPGIQPGGGRIAACLKQNTALLSPSCKKRIEQAKAMK
jgi:hypothetical protein